MTAEEQDGIADYLGLSLLEVASHRRGEGFAERGQEPLVEDYKADRRRGGANLATADNFYDRIRGCMKGTVTVLPGVDLTEPVDPDWARILEDD